MHTNCRKMQNRHINSMQFTTYVWGCMWITTQIYHQDGLKSWSGITTAWSATQHLLQATSAKANEHDYTTGLWTTTALKSLPFISSEFSQCHLYFHIPDWLLITAVNRLARLAKKTTCMCPQWFMVRIYGKRYSTLTHHIFPNREKAHIQICIGFATHKSKTLSLIQYLIP